MSIVDKIDCKVRDYIYKHGTDPKVVYLTEIDTIQLLEELAVHGFKPSMPPSYSCPHCGEPLLKFRGMKVTLIKKGMVLVE